MGHFSMHCGITHAAINGGDDCVLALLMPSEKPEDPFNGLPYNIIPAIIRGEYDSYGRIENIQETPGTKALEKAFSMPIQDIANILTCSRGSSDSLGESAKFMLPEAYKVLNSYKPFNEAMMVEFGFQQLSEKRTDLYVFPEPEAGETWWTHPRLNNEVFIRLHFWSDGRDGIYDDRHAKVYAPFNYHVKDESRLHLSHLPIGAQASYKLMDLLDAIYAGTRIHLAYSDDVAPIIHRLKQLDYVWINGTAFDSFASPRPIEGDGAGWWGESFYLHGVKEEHLLMLGFELDETASDERTKRKLRFWKQFTHESSDELVVNSDGFYSNLSKKGSPSEHGDFGSLFRVADLIKIWLTKTGFELEVPAEEKSLCSYGKSFQDSLKALRKHEKFIQEERENPSEYKRFKLELDNPWRSHGRRRQAVFSIQEEYPRWGFLQEVFKESILNGSLQEELVRFNWLRSNLLRIAHPLRPMHYSGPQDGDLEALRLFGETIMKIVADEDTKRTDW